MILSILYKSGNLEIHDDINAINIDSENREITICGNLSAYNLLRVLDEGDKVFINGTVCYENGKATMENLSGR